MLMHIQGAAEVTPFLLFEFSSFCLICSYFRNTPFLYLSFLINNCFFFSKESVYLKINKFIFKNTKMALLLPHPLL